ncbi:tyrosine-type recombinase/integrase [Nocardia abscessus]|uniref:tyrosine-type recombinase/integrase n=1 Tax=Nocardia abscessus TaxID=120957 RepID=UPI002454F567|nr:site-specific integrase [Nocardia abscessus]
MPTASGKIRRLRIYGRTRDETNKKLVAQLSDAHRGIPIPEKSWTVGAYLDYYMSEIASKTLRVATISTYSYIVQGHLKPMLGSQSLTGLTVTGLQRVFDREIADGMSIPLAIHARFTLSAALTRAMREDLIVRNVARLLVLPRYERKRIVPWTVEETSRFLKAASTEELYPAFLLLALYGMRKGEVLGLRFGDINWDHDSFQIRQQRQVVRGRPHIGPVKTAKGKRDLPLLAFVRRALNQYQTIVEERHIRPTNDRLIFVDENGEPISPDHLYQLFIKISKRTGLRRIRLHDLRHGTATLLKDLHVPDRDIQLILGHSRVSTTQEIYEHGDGEGQHLALNRLEDMLLLGVHDSGRSRQEQPSKLSLMSARQSQQRWPNDPGVVASLFSTKFSYLRRDPSLTSVLEHLRTATNSYVLGGVAVRNSRHPDRENLVLWEWISVRDSLTPVTTPFTDSPVPSSLP